MIMKFAYQQILKPILFCFTPDTVHKVFVSLGKVITYTPGARFILGLIYGRPSNNNKKVTVDGIDYAGPVMLAAGFDYNGHLNPLLWYMGFAGQEVGSVTAKPCHGNPPPNMTRLIGSQSIQVYKGLRNDGVDVILNRLKNFQQTQKTPKSFVTGVSIAKTNIADCTDQDEAVNDYLQSYQKLNEAEVGDFYTINISCPNAFGGEDFTSALALEKLLDKLSTNVGFKKPTYFKMPINLPWEQFLPLLKLVNQYGAHGVVIGNLNKDYQSLKHPEELSNQHYRGGLSGAPCQQLSNELIRKTREHFPKMTIIGCGGVLSPSDALEKLQAGANLIQLISGMIFNGPHLMNEINRQFWSEENSPKKTLQAQ